MADVLAKAVPRIAFVFGDAAAAEHVRDAVAGCAEIAYATPAQAFDPARLASAQVAAALVNVDGGAWFADIESYLQGAGVPLVFNDPAISQRLEGWDRARWLRHLAAKLAGSSDFDPPRPAPPAEAVAVADAASGAIPAVAPADHIDAVSAAMPEPAAAAGGMPLSAHEIETMTADFMAPSRLQVASTAAWNPVAVTAHVMPQAAATPQPTASAPAAVAPSQADAAPAAPEVADPVAGSAATPAGADGQTDFLDVDTEALSAMIDARLAEPAPASPVPEVGDTWSAAPGEPVPASADAPVAEPAGNINQVTALHAADPAAAGVPALDPADPDADILASLPSLDDWQLVDPESVPAPAPARAGGAPATTAPDPSDALAGLTLVPIDPTAPSTHVIEPIERWIDEAEGRSKAHDDGDKA